MMPPDWSDCPLLVIPEQAPICVFSEDKGAIVINQQHWRECEDEVFITFHAEHARTLCRAILKEAGIDPDTESREVSVKDATELRESHDQDSVTVTAEIANEVADPHQERGSATTG